MHFWLLFSFLTVTPGPMPTCESLSDDFCQALFKPENGGNLDVAVGGKLVPVRRGLTDNDMSDSNRRALELRLTNRERLPAELREELERLGYFRELEAYLRSDSWKKSTLEAGIERRDRNLQIPTLWTEAFQAAVFRGLAAEHPGLSQTTPSEWKPSWNKEAQARLEALLQKTHEAIWDNAPEWNEAQQIFATVLTELKAWLHEQSGFSPAHAAAVEADLNAIKLYSPGTHSPPSEACATTVENAMYRWTDNTVEICAGLLFSPSLPLILAHELGHALGTGRQRQRADQALAVYQLMEGLRRQECSGQRVECVDWVVRRHRLAALLSERTAQSPEPLGFFQCLQQGPVPAIDADALHREAQERAEKMIKAMSAADAFLRLTRPQTVSRTGVHEANPGYLNPCADAVHFEDQPLLDGNASAEVTFLADYECGDPALPAAERLDRAIRSTQRNAVLFAEQQLRSRGTFGRDDWLIGKGATSVVDEQEADYVGSAVNARLIARQPDLASRRNQALLSLAFLCEEPSWHQESPAEFAVQSRYTSRVHGFDAERRATLMNAASDALQCQAPPPKCTWATPVSQAAPR